MLGLCCCVQAFCSYSEWGYSSCSTWVSHCGSFSCCRTWALDTWASVVTAHGLLWHSGLVAPWHVESSWTRIKPLSLALIGGFLTTEPPGKSCILFHFRFLQDTEYSSLCYYGSLSVIHFIYIVVCISEKAMATHSSTLAWKIPWTEEAGGLPSMGSQRVQHDFTFTFHSYALEKEMATHSSVLAWRIPGTDESGGLPSMGLHRVGHD